MTRPLRYRLGPVLLLTLLILSGRASAQSYKVEAIKQPPPASFAPEILAVINGQGGYRVVDDQGKPLAEVWLRKSIPASAKPSGPKGTIQFPFLAESELLGVVQFLGEGHDYRDQTIAKGAYTMRYGLQPVNGDHLGVSPFRDYSLLLPAAKDRSLAALPRKQLESQSAESAGSSHPAIFFMGTPPAGNAAPPTMIHDEEKNTWKLVVSLELAVKGEAAPMSYAVWVIVVGVSEA